VGRSFKKNCPLDFGEPLRPGCLLFFLIERCPIYSKRTRLENFEMILDIVTLGWLLVLSLPSFSQHRRIRAHRRVIVNFPLFFSALFLILYPSRKSASPSRVVFFFYGVIRSDSLKPCGKPCTFLKTEISPVPLICGKRDPGGGQSPFSFEK